MQRIRPTHTFCPSLSVILNAELVFRRQFFFPCSVNVDRHVLQGLSPGGAVRHSTCGRLDEVPVPRKMSSTGLGPFEFANNVESTAIFSE